MTTQEKDRIECAIRHIQTAVDVDPWAVEIAVKAMKAQLSAEGTTSDPISRQNAIDALMEIMDRPNHADFLYTDEICKTLNDLPSAKPEIEERTEEFAQNVPKEDLISRKAAIDAMWEIRQKEISDGRRFHDYCSLSTAVDVIKDLPSAQPEPCESDEAAKRLNDLIFDINPAEICAQIEADNLKKWCEIIQVEMKMAMVQLPCWWKDGEVDEAD